MMGEGQLAVRFQSKETPSWGRTYERCVSPVIFSGRVKKRAHGGDQSAITFRVSTAVLCLQNALLYDCPLKVVRTSFVRFPPIPQRWRS
jgi:hypothetical protein